MFLLQHIKYYIPFYLCLVFSVKGISQEAEKNTGYSPYRSEHNPWFKFNQLQFKRGFNNESIKIAVDSLELKSRKYWKRADSIAFAEAAYKSGNIELAAYYYENLRPDYKTEATHWWNHIVIHFLNAEYNTCITILTKSVPGTVEHSKIYFFKQICLAKLNALKDNKWYKTQTVLSWEVDSTLLNVDKKSADFREKVITPLENLTFVLELLVRQIHDDDEVIARTCLEMGWILDAHISTTQAYIIMSIGRHYDKWDKEIQNNVKELRSRISETNYRIPNPRKYFPRIEAWRFHSPILEEKVIYTSEDTLERKKPVLVKEIEEVELFLPSQLIIIIGLAILFLSLLFFLKTKKNKR